jgi:hypothetical protein
MVRTLLLSLHRAVRDNADHYLSIDGVNGKTHYRVGLFGTCTQETVAMLTPAKIGPVAWSPHMQSNHDMTTVV